MKNLVKTAGVLVLAGAMAMPLTGWAQSNNNRPTSKPMIVADEHKDEHPVIQDAIKQLETVKYELKHKAAHDFGGHKQSAIDHIDGALKELHAAMNLPS